MNEIHSSPSLGEGEDTPGRVGWDGVTFGIVPHWLLGKVKPSAVVTYLALTTWAGNNDGHAFPGLRGVAERADLSEPTVRQAIKELEAVGAVRVEARYRPDGSQTSNNYWLSTGGEARNPDDPPQDSGGATPPKETEGLRTRPKKELQPSLRSGSDAESLATLLAMRIHYNGSKKPTVTQQWITDIDRMHRIDGRTWDEIRGAIEWSQAHEFWASVILSPKKLRAKFDQMRLQAIRDKRNAAANAYEKFMADDEEGSLL